MVKLFDPLGLHAPCIIMARMILQDLVVGQYQETDPWEKPLPESLKKKSKVWYDQLNELTSI